MGRGTGSRKPFTHGGRAVIFAIGDALFDELRPHALAATQAAVPGIPVEIVRASTLTDPNTEADFWFGTPPARRPGFTLLCRTQEARSSNSRSAPARSTATAKRCDRRRRSRSGRRCWTCTAATGGRRKASSGPARCVPINPRLDLIVLMKDDGVLVIGWRFHDLHDLFELLVGDVPSSEGPLVHRTSVPRYFLRRVDENRDELRVGPFAT